MKPNGMRCAWFSPVCMACIQGWARSPHISGTAQFAIMSTPPKPQPWMKKSTNITVKFVVIPINIIVTPDTSSETQVRNGFDNEKFGKFRK